MYKEESSVPNAILFTLDLGFVINEPDSNCVCPKIYNVLKCKQAQTDHFPSNIWTFKFWC